MKGVWNLFWIFIVVVSVMPLLQQKVIQAKRLGLIKKLEMKHNSRVITLIHRQETMKFLGFPIMRYIDINDSDEVIMDENAVLGPVDPQLGGYPAASILKIVKNKEPKDIEDKTLILADVAEKAQNQVRSFVKNILPNRINEESADKIAATLTDGRWTHDYPITFEEAKTLGLQVTAGLPDEVYQLMDFYPQTMQQRPSVQYIPVPYKKIAGKEEKV